MKCPKVQDHLSAYVDGEVPEELRRKLEAHLEACTICRAELAALGRLDQALATLPAPASPDVTRRVLAQVRRPARPWWRSLSIAASLVLGLVLGGALTGNFYPYSARPANGNGEVLALEDVLREFPKGSFVGTVISYQDDEGTSA
jgi:anti-sigma factor RsiW